MYHDILIPTDGSPEVASAVTRGLDLARATDATVHVLHVVDTRSEPPDLGDEARAELRGRGATQGRQAANAIREQAADLGVETRSEILEGVPHRAILEYVREHDIDLVVMGTHGRTGPERARLGSTTERVVRLADVPVMAVRRSEDGEVPVSGYDKYNHVVIPIDGSDVAERAAEHGLDIAEHYGADVHLAYVVDTTTYGLDASPRSIVGMLKEGGEKAIEAIADHARDRNIPVATVVLRGVPDDEIRAYAAGVTADLVVMGTRGRTGGPERLFGSTTARVVRRSEIPVLTVS